MDIDWVTPGLETVIGRAIDSDRNMKAQRGRVSPAVSAE